jgi:uncharacterized membrane protein (DUF4010 family)
MIETISAMMLFKFLMVLAFAFLTGLEMREYFFSKSDIFIFGTVRTITFIGVLGFVMSVIGQKAYLLGFASVSAFLLLFYFQKLQNHQKSILQILIALIVYNYMKIAEISVFYIPLLYVTIVFVINSKPRIRQMVAKIDSQESITFAKFLILSVIILPILPKSNVIEYVSISPFKIWIAVVVVSAISYFSYLLQKYFLSQAGVVVTAILGGMYSSTATTVVLSKKTPHPLVEASIVLATGVMYLRLWVIVAIFNFGLAKILLLPFLSLVGASVVIFWFLRETKTKETTTFKSNPLEIQVAFIFAILFVLMAAITQFVTTNFGNTGLQALSAIIGFTDIDPFVLSLIQGKYSVTQADLIQAILIAIASNNLLKAFYSAIFSKWKMKKAFFNLILLSILTLCWAVYFSY